MKYIIDDYAIPSYYINNTSFDATQDSTSSKHKSELIPRLHQRIQNHPSLEYIHSSYKDLQYGISYQFLRFQAS